MTARYDIAALKKRLHNIRTEDNPALVRQKSRDFYWYSPVLKRQLDHVAADIVVSPASRDEVIETLAAAYALGIPVTPRGTGRDRSRDSGRGCPGNPDAPIHL